MKTKKLKLEKLQITKLKNSHVIFGGDADEMTVGDEKKSGFACLTKKEK